MKGALLISLNEHMFDALVLIARDDGADYSPEYGGLIQATDDSGRSFTLYPAGRKEAQIDLGEPLNPASEEVHIPEMDRVTVCVVECRWEDLFVETVGRFASRLSFPLWVLDDRDVVWNADDIDPKRIFL
jgi:hypothetical protein